MLATLVLEPDTNNSRGQTRHLNQLLFHKRIGSRVGIEKCAEGKREISLINLSAFSKVSISVMFAHCGKCEMREGANEQTKFLTSACVTASR